MRYKQGDVVLVKVIFSERMGAKKRPALVISDECYHYKREEIIIAAITSNTERILPGDTLIGNWQNSGLIYPSLVTGIIQTIKIEIIERKLGELSSSDFLKFQDNLKKILGF